MGAPFLEGNLAMCSKILKIFSAPDPEITIFITYVKKIIKTLQKILL